jgi:voltage-gated potassium channel
MLILAFAFVAVFVLQYWPDVSSSVVRVAEFAEYFIIAIFAAELVVKVAVADNRTRYLRTHWLDVLILLVPFLRPLRPLRLLRLMPFLVRGAIGIRRVMGPYQGSYVLVVGLLSVLLSSILMVVVEHGAGDNAITDFGDALWWAIATVTTIGYGDAVPHTLEGKAVAVLLMLVGISLFSIFTAGIAAYFVGGAVRKERGAGIKELVERLDKIEARIEGQNKALAALVVQRDKQEQKL